MDEFQSGHQDGLYNLHWERPNSRHPEAGLRLTKVGTGIVPFKIRLAHTGTRHLEDFCDHFKAKRSRPDPKGHHFFAFHPVWLDVFLKDGGANKTFLVITPIEAQEGV